MAQENNTAREQTALEKLSQDALNQARRERKMIQDTCIAELAQCDTEIPEALEKQVQAEIASRKIQMHCHEPYPFLLAAPDRPAVKSRLDANPR